jgi:cytidylate kinase
VLRVILTRDARDGQRGVAPLKPAFDAVLVVTSGVPIGAVVEKVLSLVPESLRLEAATNRPA